MALTVKKTITEVTCENTVGDNTLGYVFRVSGSAIEGGVSAKVSDKDGKNLGNVTTRDGENFTINMNVPSDFDSSTIISTAKADLIDIFTNTSNYVS